MAKKATYSPVRQNVFGATLARFVGKRRSRAKVAEPAEEATESNAA